MNVLEWIVYLMIYLSAGATLKLGDDLLDELNRTNFAYIPLTVSGVLFGYLMTLSEWDLVLLSAIIIGVIVSGKVNQPPFLLGFAAIAGVFILRGIPSVTDWLDWSTLLISLFLAAVLDERGNDWTDRSFSPRANAFFRYRFTLKVSVLLLCIPWPLFLGTALGLWFFDLGYELVGLLVRHYLLHRPSDTQDHSIRP
jgi:hypothetical protein